MRRTIAVLSSSLPALLLALGGALAGEPAVVQGALPAILLGALAALPLHLLSDRGLGPALAGQMSGLLIRLLGGLGIAWALGFGQTAAVCLAVALALGVVLDALLLSLSLRTPVAAVTGEGDQLRA